MQNTLACQLLHTFTKQDIREARKWLASPYHNQREDLQQLFELLASAAPESQPPGREQAWQSLHPNEPYDDQQLRLLLSYLYRCLEDFLRQREAEQAPWLHQHLLLAAYRKRGLDSHFQKTCRKLDNQQQAAPQRFPQAELHDLFLLAINFCIRKINQTAEGYLREALELYQKGLETEALLENGALSRFTYNNAIGIALRLEEFGWA